MNRLKQIWNWLFGSSNLNLPKAPKIEKEVKIPEDITELWTEALKKVKTPPPKRKRGRPRKK